MRSSRRRRRGLLEEQGAQRLLGRARDLRPGRPEILVVFARLRTRQGDPDEAVALLTRATTVAPHDPSIALHLGHALLARGQRAVARRAFTRALTLRPSPELAAKLHAALASLDAAPR